MAALANSVSIFERLQEGSLEAHRAYVRLTALLKKLQGHSESGPDTAYPLHDTTDSERYAGLGSDPSLTLNKPIPLIDHDQTRFPTSNNSGMSLYPSSELVSLPIVECPYLDYLGNKQLTLFRQNGIQLC